MKTQDPAPAGGYNRAGLNFESRSRNQEKNPMQSVRTATSEGRVVPRASFPPTLLKTKQENQRTIQLSSCRITKQYLKSHQWPRATLEKQRKRKRASWSLERKVPSVLETSRKPPAYGWMKSLRLRILKLFFSTPFHSSIFVPRQGVYISPF